MAEPTRTPKRFSEGLSSESGAVARAAGTQALAREALAVTSERAIEIYAEFEGKHLTHKGSTCGMADWGIYMLCPECAISHELAVSEPPAPGYAHSSSRSPLQVFPSHLDVLNQDGDR